MKIVVIGGTGIIGSKVASKLSKRGYKVIAAAPETGVNVITGEGHSDVFKGVQKVVDVANSPSFEDKASMEELVKESKIPYTILHSTQFFEFACAIVKGGTEGNIIHLSSALFQPIASDDTVDALADVIVAEPLNKAIEVIGKNWNE